MDTDVEQANFYFREVCEYNEGPPDQLSWGALL